MNRVYSYNLYYLFINLSTTVLTISQKTTYQWHPRWGSGHDKGHGDPNSLGASTIIANKHLPLYNPFLLQISKSFIFISGMSYHYIRVCVPPSVAVKRHGRIKTTREQKDIEEEGTSLPRRLLHGLAWQWTVTPVQRLGLGLMRLAIQFIICPV